jgi:hypothetical protein
MFQVSCYQKKIGSLAMAQQELKIPMTDYYVYLDVAQQETDHVLHSFIFKGAIVSVKRLIS